MKQEEIVYGQALIDVPPSPELNKALARTGYDPYQALCEVIDNSSDAIKNRLEEQESQDKGTIYIIAKNWESDSLPRELVVVDTGCGMNNNNHSLAHVWGLGQSSESKTQNTENRCGVFGIGLKAATMSIASSATFTSRSALSQRFRTSVYNPSEQRKRGDWKIPVFDLCEETTEQWAVNKYLKNQVGTVLVLRGLHEGYPAKQDKFYNNLETEISRIYRKDLKDGIYQVKLGKNRILDESNTIDPLVSLDPNHNSEWFFGGPNHCDTFEFEGHRFEIRACHWPMGYAGNSKSNIKKTLGSGISGNYKRGVYFLRNGREIGILSGDSSGFWRLPTASNYFVEINFLDNGNSSDLPVQTDFGKKSVKMIPNYVSFMRRKLDPSVRKVGAYKVKSKPQSVSDTKKIYEQIVGSSIKVLRRGKTESTKSSSGVVSKTAGDKTYRTRNTYKGKSSEPFYIDYSDGYRAKAKFEHVEDFMRRDFPFWEEQQSDGTVKIFINEATSFVQSLIKVDENYSFLYPTAAGLVISVSNNVKDANERTEVLGGFGSLVNDFTDKKRKSKVAEVMNMESGQAKLKDAPIAVSGQ